MSKVNIYFKVIDEVTIPILLWIHKVRSRNIQIWYDKSIQGDKLIIAKMKTKCDIEFNDTDNSISFFEWKLSQNGVESIYCGLKHLISRNCIHNTKFIVIDNASRSHQQMIVFRDAEHKEELPDSFIKVPCFSSVEETYDYCKAQSVFEFSLEDQTKFTYESGITPPQGAKVFRQISTGKYWYLDMLHKDHYEVFDSAGKKHLGEANIETGELNSAKRDKDKKAIK